MSERIVRASQKVEIPSSEKIRLSRFINTIKSTGASVRMDKFRESFGPDLFDALLSNYMNRRLAMGYQTWDVSWRNLVTIKKNVSMLDQYIVRMGEFENLDAIANTGGVFQDFTPPSDDEISYEVAGYGNILAVDFKTHKSDDLGWFDKTSFQTGKAAMRTLHNYLFVTMLQSNPTVDDGNSLFDDTNHSNDADNAGAGKTLNYANAATVYDKISAQTDANSNPVYVEGVWLVCGTTYKINAQTLMNSDFNPDTANREPNFFKEILKGYVICPYLGNDWYMYADPSEMETFEIGFLDDEDEPVLSYLDPQVSDTYFREKKFMWRVEYYFGGNWVDWRGVCRGSQNV